MTPRLALFALIAASSALRLAWAAALGPGNDEAYHALFAAHPDWSYFDHPPMLALVERAGLAVAGGHASAFGLRLGFVALFAGSTWLMARLASRDFGEWAGFYAALALNASAYHTAAASTFALPDGPLLFFWLLTLDRLAAAFATPGRTRPWAWVGLAWGGAMLSKYHAVFLPVGALLYIAVEPGARRWLARPGPYLAAAMGVAVFSPVLAWNASHGWASFAFQGGRAVAGLQFRPDRLAGAVAAMAAYLLPWMFVALAVALAGMVRRALAGGPPGPRRDAERFLLAQAAPPLLLFLGVACVRPVLPHWSLVGFLPVFPAVGRAWAALAQAEPARMRRRAAFLAAVPIALAAFVAVQERTGFVQSRLLPARPEPRPGSGLAPAAGQNDPTADMFGWDQVAAELARRGLLGREDTFLFTGSWYLSGQVAFALAELPGDAARTPVLCYNAGDARGFAFWGRPEDWLGRDGVLVSINDRVIDPGAFDRYFDRIEPLGEFAVVRAGAAMRSVRLFRCRRQTVAFPFDGRAATADPRRLAGAGGGRAR